MELQLICNPTAGNGLALETAKVMEEKLKAQHIPYTMMMTERVGHATVLAAAAALKGYDTVAAIGGDGTLLEVASGLCNSKTSMGIIPAGTGNDFIKTAKIPKDPMEALNVALTGTAAPVDMGRLGEGSFLNVCGTGFDVTVLDFAESLKQRYRGLLHGEAVGVGMLMTARLSEALGITARGTAARIEACLSHYRLPVYADADNAAVEAALRSLPRFDAAVPERVGWTILRQLDSAFLLRAWQYSGRSLR